MFNKCSLLFVSVLAVAVAASVIPRAVDSRASFNINYVGNNLYIGQRQVGDWQLAGYTVWQPAVAKRVVTYTLNINAAYNLTYIAAIDQSYNKTLGAFPSLQRGGPGSKNATLFFTSKVGQPIYSLVSSYGRR